VHDDSADHSVPRRGMPTTIRLQSPGVGDHGRLLYSARSSSWSASLTSNPSACLAVTNETTIGENGQPGPRPAAAPKRSTTRYSRQDRLAIFRRGGRRSRPRWKSAGRRALW
jgi:hypothetical protein